MHSQEQYLKKRNICLLFYTLDISSTDVAIEYYHPAKTLFNSHRIAETPNASSSSVPSSQTRAVQRYQEATPQVQSLFHDEFLQSTVQEQQQTAAAAALLAPYQFLAPQDHPAYHRIVQTQLLDPHYNMSVKKIVAIARAITTLLKVAKEKALPPQEATENHQYPSTLKLEMQHIVHQHLPHYNNHYDQPSETDQPPTIDILPKQQPRALLEILERHIKQWINPKNQEYNNYTHVKFINPFQL